MHETSNGTSVLERLELPRQFTSDVSAPSEKSLKKPDSIFARLIRNASTLLVLLALAGIAYVGHHAGWTIPRFDDLIGKGQPAKGDWCSEHSVPESICVECNESLLPKGKDSWCRKHGVHNCTFENPGEAQLKSLPKIEAVDLDRAQRALDLKERKENNSKCKLHLRRLQLASEQVMNKMGIDIGLVWRGPMEETLSASGEITYQQPRVASLSALLPGRVWKITDKGQVGVRVKEGDVLALVEAVEVGKAKAELLQALSQVDVRGQTVERLRSLAGTGVSEARFLDAQSAYREAEIRLLAAHQALVNLGLPVSLEEAKKLSSEELGRRLQFLGLPQNLSKTLDPRTTTANLIPVTASRDGIVSAVKVVTGELADPAKTLFVIVDNSQMWLTLNVRIEDKKYLRVRDDVTRKAGQAVRFRPDGSDREIMGELVWMDTAIDEKTRTIKARADLANLDGLLAANTFGTGAIILREEKEAIVVPNEALHWEGDCHIVFVRDKNFLAKDAPKVFHVRTVRPGVKNAENTEILAGVLPGEVVATRNSAALRAELLKNRLGEG